MTNKKILYIYPHPDDESFGPAGTMHYLARKGFEVFLLTLTRGEATTMRHKLGIDKDEMGRIRSDEMEKVVNCLNLKGMTILDFPDGQLKELNPVDIEQAVEKHIRSVNPHVVITYPVHGISGFHDHLVTHAVVKRVFCQLKNESGLNLQRLSFMALPAKVIEESTYFSLHGSEDYEIDAIVEVEEEDYQAHLAALDCYATYKEVIEKTGIKKHISKTNYFEIFQEQHDPPLKDLIPD